MITPLTATATLDRARTALQNGKGAGLPELLKIIETISTNLGKVTIQDLAELIEKDAAVLARIVQIANTIVHNPGFTPLSSLTHAIHQIGFARVRSLTLSIMLIENAGARNPPEQREAAAQALCAGLLAQACAQKFGYVDAEAAFACAALRNFGRIILPAVSIEHYREALQRLKDKPEDIAFRGMFGLTPLELSRRLLAGARLPEEFMRALRDASPESLAGTSTLPETRLLAMADFGSRIACLALDGGMGSERFGEETRALARRFNRIVPDALEYIPVALEHADARLAGFLRTDGIAALPTASLNRIRARVQHTAPDAVVITAAAPGPGPDVLPAHGSDPTAADAETPPAAATTPADASTPVEAPGAAHEEPAPTVPAPPAAPAPEPEEAWTDTLARSAAFATQSTPPVTSLDPWLAVLTLVRDRFDAHEAWLFQPRSGGDSLAITHGVGDSWKKFQPAAALRRDERTVFGVCLARHETVVIHNIADPALRPYLPDWLRRAADTAPRSFLLVPATGEGGAPGLALIGWREARKLAFSPTQAEIVRQLFRSVAVPAGASAPANAA